MGRIFAKSALVAFASLVASLLLAYTVVPTLGGVVDGNARLVQTMPSSPPPTSASRTRRVVTT